MKHSYQNIKPYSQFINESAEVDGLSAVLRDIHSRMKSQFDEYLEDNDLQQDAADDFDYEFEQFLSREIGIDIDSDNLITFNAYDPSYDTIIGELPVLLYHYTSSTLLPSIKEQGLQTGFHQTNPHGNSYAGVYLTTEYSGAAIDGYVRRAVNMHEGEGVRLHIKAYMSELQPDVDDADIKSGDCQFTIDCVAPERILQYTRYL